MACMDTVEVAKSVRKPRGQGASRRGEILDAAKRLFLTEGFERATIRKIAATVGVSSAALYLYFPDKDAILRAIAESTFEALLARLEDAERRSGTDLDRLRAGLHAYVGFRTCASGRISADLSSQDDGVQRAWASLRHMRKRPCRRPVFRYSGEQYSKIDAKWRIPDRRTTGHREAVWASLHGTTALLLDQAEHIESAPDALVARVIDIVVAGLSA